MGYHRKAHLGDLEDFLENIRDEDRREVEAMVGMSPANALPWLVLAPSTRAILTDEGDVLGLYGVTPLDKHPGVGVIWMLTTKRFPEHFKEFYRKCKAVIAEMNEEYPILWNYIDARNTSHHRLVKLLGFKFICKHERWGVQGLPFYEIVRLQTL